MKKLISVLIVLAVCLTCIIPAFADMDVPNFKEYEAYVSNPLGITVTDYGKFIYIPYNTKLTITGEYDGRAACSYNDRYIEIDLDDISKEKSDVDVSEAVKLEHAVTYVSIAKDGAKIRKGPAESYDEVGSIPYGEEVTVAYGIQEETFYLPWAYCSYGETAGWIHVVQFGAGFDFATKLTSGSGKSGKVTVLRDGARLADKPDYFPGGEIDSESDTHYITGSIPVGTTFTYDVYYDDRGFYAYVEYGGVMGWLECGGYTNGFYSEYVTSDQINSIYIYGGSADIYSEPFCEGEKLGTVPENTLTASYSYGSRLVNAKTGKQVADYPDSLDGLTYLNTDYVEYNGVSGWITNSYDHDFKTLRTSNSESVTFTKDADYYSDAELTEKAGTIPAGTECCFIGYDDATDSRVIVYDGKLAFVDEDTEENTYTVLSEDEIAKILEGIGAVTDEKATEAPDRTEVFEESEPAENAEESTGRSTLSAVIIIAAAVVIIFIAALVSIIFIRKRKSAQSSDSTESNE